MQSRVNPAASNIDSRVTELAFDLGTKRRCSAVAVVGVIETENIWPVMGEPSQLFGEFGKFIEIEQEPERAIAEAVHARLQAPMHDRSDIERRTRRHICSSAFASVVLAVRTIRPDSFATCHGRRTLPSCSATASPACNPSS